MEVTRVEMYGASLTLSERLDGDQPPAVRQLALIELVDTASEPLRRYLVSRQVPADQRDDVAAETWLTVVELIQRGAFHVVRGEAVSYVIGIARMLLKRRPLAWTYEAALEDAAALVDAADAFAVTEATLDVARAAALLRHPEDQVVLAAILAQHTIPEMATLFGCSYKTAWRRYHRCLLHCRQALVPEAEAALVAVER